MDFEITNETEITSEFVEKIITSPPKSFPRSSVDQLFKTFQEQSLYYVSQVRALSEDDWMLKSRSYNTKRYIICFLKILLKAKRLKLSQTVSFEQFTLPDKPGSFLSIPHLSLAGLKTVSSQFYIRNEWVKLWEELNSTVNCLLHGPPGTGKSSSIWAWCCWKSITATVRWIHIDTKTMVDLNCGQIIAAQYDQRDLVDIVRATKSNILVVDGNYSDLLGPLGVWVGYEDRQLIVVSSEQIDWKQTAKDRLEMKTIVSCGWTLDEYVNACNNEKFFTTIAHNFIEENEEGRDSIIKHKYFFAGASARWMFTCSVSNVKNEIDYHISKAGDLRAIVSRMPKIRTSHVNCLTTVLESIPIPVLVSEYTSRQISIYCEVITISEMNKIIPPISNGSFHDWIFRMDFLRQLYTLGKIKGNLLLSSEEWPVLSPPSEFYQDNELKVLLKCIPSSDPVWFVPINGCYDALQIHGTTIRVVQLVVAQRHPVKLKFVRRILEILKNVNIEIKEMDFVFAVPPENNDSFQVLQAFGNKNKAIC